MRFALSPAEGGQIERGLPALRQKLLQQRKSAADRLAGRGDSPAALHRQSGFAAAAVGKGAAAAKTNDPVPLHNDLRAAGIHIAGVCVGIEAQRGQQRFRGYCRVTGGELRQLRQRVGEQGKRRPDADPASSSKAKVETPKSNCSSTSCKAERCTAVAH